MTNLISKINSFCKEKSLKLIDISSGIIITRKVLNNKPKFLSDNNLSPKHHLDLQKFLKKKYPSLLDTSFYKDQELTFLYASPTHAYKANSYKEELYLISIDNYFIQTVDCFLPAKTLNGTYELDFSEESNYLVITYNNSREITNQKIFYCDDYIMLKEANEEATFGNFLQLLKDEDINNESLLISYLAKMGIPLEVQNKYLEFWDYRNQYLNCIDDLVYKGQRNQKIFNTIFPDIYLDDRQVNLKLAKYFKYDLEKVYTVLDYFI